MSVSMETVRNNDCPLSQIDCLYISFEEIHLSEKLADRVHDICEIQIAGRDLMQHWSEQEEVLAIHERNFHIRMVCQPLLEFKRGIEAAKSATQDENTMLIAHGNLR